MSIPLRSRSSRKVQTNQSNLFPHSLSVYFFLSFDALVSLSRSLTWWKQPCRSHSPDTLFFRVCVLVSFTFFFWGGGGRKTRRPDVKGSLVFAADQPKRVSPHSFNHI
jgi:hypothetical protein